MKMKSTKSMTIVLGLACIITVMSGCTKEKDTFQDYGVKAMALITSPTGETLVSEGIYKLNFNYTAGGSQIVSPDILLPGSTTSFTTKEFPFSSYLVTGYGVGGTLFTGSAESAGNAKNGSALTDMKYQLAPMYVPAPEYQNITYTPIPGSGLPQPELSFNLPAGVYLLSMQCKIGEYTMRTFWNDVTYMGTTNTRVAGVPGSEFQSGDVCYRVKLYPETGKANVYIYNAQFNDRMPAMAILMLTGLDVTFNSRGYTIHGQNINPLQINNGTLLENPQFPFANFVMQTNEKMTGVDVAFTVKTVIQATGMEMTYEGNFSGNNMITFTE